MFGRPVTQQPVEMRRGEPVDERRQPTRARVSSRARGVQRARRGRAAPARSPGRRTRTRTPIAARREHRVPALRLARVDVRDVHLDERHRHADECVAQREARVRVRAGVHDRAVDRPRSACTASISSPSPLCCEHSSSTPSSLATSRKAALDVREACRARRRSGSRAPSRLRLGPLRTAILTASSAPATRS